jgi:multidrug transporter EmrE-like cation transporter
MRPIWWLVLSAIFFAVGEFYSKKWAVNPCWQKLALLLVSYLVGILCWLPAILQTKQLALTGAIWSVLSLAATVLLGTLVFKENLEVVHWVGMGTAAVSVFLLSL